jgi:hypothetical protein
MLHHGEIIITGKTSQVEEALSYLEFRPGCIFDRNLALELDLTISASSVRLLNQSAAP